MAGSITHLAIANKIIKKLGNGIIKDEGFLYAGSIAPDAIHARKEYMREFKKITHLKDGISGKDFNKEENLVVFYEKINLFIDKYVKLNDSNIDLYRGYIIHVLTDELFYSSIREEFVKDMEQVGILQTDREFYTRHMRDIDNNNFMLASKLSDLDIIFLKLQKLGAYEIKDILKEDELRASRNWIINKFSNLPETMTEGIYIGYNQMIRFIDEASVDIVRRLSDNKVFTKIL